MQSISRLLTEMKHESSFRSSAQGSLKDSKVRAFKARAKGLRQSLVEKVGKTKSSWIPAPLISQQGSPGESTEPGNEEDGSGKFSQVFAKVKSSWTQDQPDLKPSCDKSKLGSAHFGKLASSLASLISEHAVPAAKSTIAHIRSEVSQLRGLQFGEEYRHPEYIRSSGPDDYCRTEYGPEHYLLAKAEERRLKRELAERIRNFTPEEARAYEAELAAEKAQKLAVRKEIQRQREMERLLHSMHFPCESKPSSTFMSFVPVEDFGTRPKMACGRLHEGTSTSEIPLTYEAEESCSESEDESASFEYVEYCEEAMEGDAESADSFDWGSFSSAEISEGEAVVEIINGNTGSLRKVDVMNNDQINGGSPAIILGVRAVSHTPVISTANDFDLCSESASIISNDESDHGLSIMDDLAYTRTLHYMSSNDDSSYHEWKKQPLAERPFMPLDVVSSGFSISLRSALWGSKHTSSSRVASAKIQVDQKDQQGNIPESGQRGRGCTKASSNKVEPDLKAAELNETHVKSVPETKVPSAKPPATSLFGDFNYPEVVNERTAARRRWKATQLRRQKRAENLKRIVTYLLSQEARRRCYQPLLRIFRRQKRPPVSLWDSLELKKMTSCVNLREEFVNGDEFSILEDAKAVLCAAGIFDSLTLEMANQNLGEIKKKKPARVSFNKTVDVIPPSGSGIAQSQNKAGFNKVRGILKKPTASFCTTGSSSSKNTATVTREERKVMDSQLWANATRCQRLVAQQSEKNDQGKLEKVKFAFETSLCYSTENYSKVAHEQVLHYTRRLAEVKLETASALGLLFGLANVLALLLDDLGLIKESPASLAEVESRLAALAGSLGNSGAHLDGLQSEILKMHHGFASQVGPMVSLAQNALVSRTELERAHGSFSKLQGAGKVAGFDDFIRSSKFLVDKSELLETEAFARSISHLEVFHRVADDALKYLQTQVHKILSKIPVAETSNGQSQKLSRDYITKSAAEETHNTAQYAPESADASILQDFGTISGLANQVGWMLMSSAS